MSYTQADLADIEQLTREESSVKRRELLDAITNIFLVTVSDQTGSDNDILSDLMERIAYALEIEARAQLSERISRTERVSHGLIVRLANDDISVAKPVLERSPVLRDTDLIDIIRNRSHDHMYSIAGREAIATKVSDELVDHGDDRTLNRLTGNHGAEISEPGFGKIVVRANDNPELTDALDTRNDLPEALVQRVKSRVAGRVKSELAQSKPDVDDKFVAALIEHCAENIELDYSDDSIAEIDRLHNMGAITEDVVAHYAREKHVPDLVYCLSLLTGLDDWSVSQCLLKAELPALAILCKANGFNSSTFLLLAENRTSGNMQSSALARAMREYEALTTATAERIMRYLKLRLRLSHEKAAVASGNSA